MQLGADAPSVRRCMVAAACALLTASATRSQAMTLAKIEDLSGALASAPRIGELPRRRRQDS
jgi:hypothetical protein